MNQLTVAVKLNPFKYISILTFLHQILSKSKVFNHAGDTTYKTQNYPNSIMTKTVNVKVYKNIKIDTQRHITDKTLGGGWK